MYVDEGIVEYFAASPGKRLNNSLYWRSLRSLLHFLVPTGKRTYEICEPYSSFGRNDFEYVVLPDVLGYAMDAQRFLESMHDILVSGGKIVITEHNSLWEPVLRVASAIGLRSARGEQNWLSPHDLRTFLRLAGFEVIREGNKLLCPAYIPLVSTFCNTILANIWPFSKLGLIHYVVACSTPREIQKAPSISIIVPARNEAGTIGRIINELPSLGSLTEIIFVEGNSSDDTLSVIRREVESYKGDKKLLYAVQKGKGKGDAVRRGFAMATGDILTIYDADMTVPPDDLEKFYKAIVNGAGEFINGSRLVYPVEKGAMRILNFFGNKFFSMAFTAILGQPLKDTLCGTKMLWKKDYESIEENRSFFGDFDPFGDFDLLFGAAKLNLKIVEVPIRYKERVYGSTNISRWSHGWLLLKMTVFAARKLRFW